MTSLEDDDWYWLEEIPVETMPLEVLSEFSHETRRRTDALRGFAKLFLKQGSNLTSEQITWYLQTVNYSLEGLNTFREKVKSYLQRRIEYENSKQ